MCKICPNCKAIAEYNAYYGRITCTRCSWESGVLQKENKPKLKFKIKNSEKNIQAKLLKA